MWLLLHVCGILNLRHSREEAMYDADLHLGPVFFMLFYLLLNFSSGSSEVTAALAVVCLILAVKVVLPAVEGLKSGEKCCVAWMSQTGRQNPDPVMFW